MLAMRLIAALKRAAHVTEPDETESLTAFRSGVGRKPAMTPERRLMFAEVDEKLAGVAVWRDRPSR